MSLRCFFGIVGKSDGGIKFWENIGIELKPILQKGMGFCFLMLNTLRFTLNDLRQYEHTLPFTSDGSRQKESDTNHACLPVSRETDTFLMKNG